MLLGAAPPALLAGVAAPAAGPLGLAPFVRPWLAGSRYVVAATEAWMCGKPCGAASSPMPSIVMKRPDTDTCRLRTTRKCSSRPTKSDRWKKLPVKVNANGIVGKPAAPTDAPGGSVAVVACVAAADPVAAGGAGAGADVPEPWPTFSERKSTLVALAACWTWTISEATLSSPGTAAPSRATVA